MCSHFHFMHLQMQVQAQSLCLCVHMRAHVCVCWHKTINIEIFLVKGCALRTARHSGSSASVYFRNKRKRQIAPNIRLALPLCCWHVSMPRHGDMSRQAAVDTCNMQHAICSWLLCELLCCCCPCCVQQAYVFIAIFPVNRFAACQKHLAQVVQPFLHRQEASGQWHTALLQAIGTLQLTTKVIKTFPEPIHIYNCN